MEETRSLAQRQAKEHAERACRLNRNIGIHGLGATRASLGRCPGLDGVLTALQGDVTAIAQRLVIRTPLFHAVRRCVCGISMGSLVGLGHALHRGLSGWVMAKHDARFSGRQEHLRDLCTKAYLTPSLAPEMLSCGQKTHAASRS
jgi:hypothetical protein